MLNTVHSRQVTQRFIMAMQALLEGGTIANTTEFAAAIGSHRPHLSAMAAGRRFATVDHLVAACHAYGINPTWLMLGSGRMFRPASQQKEPVSAS